MNQEKRTLTKRDIIREIGRRTRLTNAQSASMVEAAIEILSEHLGHGGRIEIENFLTLFVQPRPINIPPEAGDQSIILTRHSLKCRPGKRLRIMLRELTQDK